MVLGLRSKNKKGSFIVDYIIHIQEIKPWPPSQSLKALRSVVLQWENGDRYSGITNSATPSIGSTAAEGKIEFNESFKLEVTLKKEGSSKGNNRGPFQKNLLEFNLYEPRRDKSKGQHLGNAMIDFAEHGVVKEAVTVSIPVNSKRNFRNTAQPLLYVKIQPFEKDSASSSKDNLLKEVSLDEDGKESVSALINEEYAEEADIASFTDDDISSHSSLAISSSAEAHPDFSVHSSIDDQESYKDASDEWKVKGVNEKEPNLPSDSLPTDEVRTLPHSSLVGVSVTESIENGDNSLSSSPRNSSMVILEKSDTISTVSSSSLTHKCHEEETVSSNITEPLIQKIPEKMINSRNGETIAQDPEEKEHKTVMNIAETSDTECLKDTSKKFKSDQNIENDIRPQESRNEQEETSSRHIEDCIFSKMDIASKSIEARQMVKVEEVEDYSTDGQQLTSTPESLSTSLTQQHSVDLTRSGKQSLGEKHSGTFSSERFHNLKLSVRSPVHLKGNITKPNDQYTEDVKEIDVQEDLHDWGTSPGTNDGSGNREILNLSQSKVKHVHVSRVNRSAFSNNKVQELELKVKLLEGELREAAAIEIGLYSIIAEHGSSVHKVHTPARRLSRLYHHASKQWPVERRACAARSIVSGLSLAAKACGNDIPRLTFWLSNTVVLRAIFTETLGHTHVSKPSGPYYGENGSGRIINSKSSPLKWESITRKNEKFSFSKEFDYWEHPEIFISALGKLETWMFSRIIESVWWQTMTPCMHSAKEGDERKRVASSNKSYARTSSMGDQQQANLSIKTWEKAFKDASEKLCPVRAGGHECGCLPMLAKLVMEQCVTRLDVAMFNAILRDSDDEIPTDPLSDPISDPKVLPIASRELSFGTGARLKHTIGNWSMWLTDLFGMDVDDSPSNENEQDDIWVPTGASFKPFRLLNALSNLLMLPKDMILEKSLRKAVCPTFSSSLIKQILSSFLPDEFCSDPIPNSVLEALDIEEPLENSEEIRNIPCNVSPITYSPPSTRSIECIIGEIQSPSPLLRSRSSLVRKCHTSDGELDELDTPLASIMIDRSPSPRAEVKDLNSSSALRYQLLREVWKDDE